MNSKEEMQEAPLGVDTSSAGNGPKNMGITNPQFLFPTFVPNPLMTSNFNASLNIKMMQEYFSQQMSQNSNKAGNSTSQRQAQSTHQTDVPHEAFKSTSNPMIDQEMMQNMMQMHYQRMLNQPAYQSMMSAGNPMDIFNFMNYTMMASQFLPQFSTPYPMNPTQKEGQNFGDLFRRNMNNLQNFYATIGNMSHESLDEKTKFFQDLGAINSQSKPSHKKYQEEDENQDDDADAEAEAEVEEEGEDQLSPCNNTHDNRIIANEDKIHPLNDRENGTLEIENYQFRTRRTTDDTPKKLNSAFHAEKSKRRQSVPQMEEYKQQRNQQRTRNDFHEKIIDERPITGSGMYNIEQFDPSTSQIKKSEETVISQSANEPQEKSQTRKHSLDEVPISRMGTKKFEDLIEEQFQNDPIVTNESSSPIRDDSPGDKKTYLKKKGKLFLASSANRSLRTNSAEHNKNTESNHFISPKEGTSQRAFFSQSSKGAISSRKTKDAASFSSGTANPQISEKEEIEKDEQNTLERKSNRDLVRRIFAKEARTTREKKAGVSQSSFTEGGKRAESEKPSNFKMKPEPKSRKRPEVKQDQFSKTAGDPGKLKDYSSTTLTEKRERRPTSEDEAVQEKIEALSSEIEKLKLENERAKKIRQKHEDMLRNLNKEIDEFEKRKVQQERDFAIWKEEELKKLRKENKVAEKNRMAKEKEEIEALKKQISKMQDEFRIKEQKYFTQIEQMKKQMDAVNLRNHQLMQESDAPQTAKRSNNKIRQGSMPEALEGYRDSHNRNLNNGNRKQLKHDAEEIFNKSLPASGKRKETKADHPDVTLASQSVSSGNNQPGSQFDKISRKEDNDPIMRLKKRAPLETEYNFDSNLYYQSYLKQQSANIPVKNETTSKDGRVQRIYEDGKKEVIFENGVKREIFRFADNQIEFHNNDSTRDIYYIDGTKKHTAVNGEETTLFNDGTIQRISSDKTKHINFSSGQRDVIYPDGSKIRTYPDGRVKKYDVSGKIEERTDQAASNF